MTYPVQPAAQWIAEHWKSVSEKADRMAKWLEQRQQIQTHRECC